jgi:hypothetical protein
MSLSRAETINDGDTATAAIINSELNNIVNRFGSIDNSDITAAAAIVGSKLDLSSGTTRIALTNATTSPGLQITSSSTGDLIKLIDGATTRFLMADGGATTLTTAAYAVNATGAISETATTSISLAATTTLSITAGTTVAASPNVWENKVINVLPTSMTLPSSNAPALTLVEGTNQTFYVLAYDKDTEEKAYITFDVPDWYDSATDVTFKVKYRTTAIAGNVIFKCYFLGTDEGESTDAALSSVAFAADTVNGTTLYMNEVTVTQAAPWAAGDQAIVCLSRSGGTLAADAQVIQFSISFNGQ